MKNLNYPAKLTKEKNGGYLVRFCDFPEAITQGESLEDALAISKKLEVTDFIDITGEHIDSSMEITGVMA